MVNSSQSKSLLAIWRNGLTLSEAMDHYGNNSESAKLQRSAAAAIRRNKKNRESENQQLRENPVAAFKIIPTHLEPWLQIQNAKIHRIKSICDLLKQEKLIALGFAIAGDLNNGPVKIPIPMFDPDFAKIRKSAFVGFGHEYRDVRICAPNAPEVSCDEPARVIGRPRLRDDVERAVAALIANNIVMRGAAMESPSLKWFMIRARNSHFRLSTAMARREKLFAACSPSTNALAPLKTHNLLRN